MRVVEKAADFASRLDEARREAGGAFGNDAVFLERYIRRGKFYVDGWLHSDAARAVVALTDRQRTLDITGGVAEIGVHHGKLFILLYLLGGDGEKAVGLHRRASW